jgi:hypothetical protein
MPESELSLEMAYGVLLEWSRTLANHVESRKAEIFKSVSPTTLHVTAPSGAAAALLVFSTIKSDLEEVVAAAGYVEDAIFRLDERVAPDS